MIIFSVSFGAETSSSLRNLLSIIAPKLLLKDTEKNSLFKRLVKNYDIYSVNGYLKVKINL